MKISERFDKPDILGHQVEVLLAPHQHSAPLNKKLSALTLGNLITARQSSGGLRGMQRIFLPGVVTFFCT